MTDLALTLPAALNVSEKTAELFARAGITTLRELILHLPLRYEDRSHLTPIAALRDGATVQICGEIVHADLIQRQKRILTVTVRDEAGDLCKLLYFNYYPSQQKAFVPGRRGLYYGKACWTPRGYQIHHPEITWLEAGQIPQLAEHLYPVYPTVKGLGQARWQGIIKKALDLVLPTLPEADPLTAAGYLPLPAALTALHRPPDNSSPDALLDRSHPARRRLILEELCAHQLAIQNARARVRSQRALALSADAPLLRDFRAALPYTLTRAQERVCAEIAADLAQATPMMRLVQGDVGSGKTIVALAACLQAIAAGSQAVLMVPTELLAEQHAANLRRLLAHLPVNITTLTSKMAGAEKRAAIAAIADAGLVAFGQRADEIVAAGGAGEDGGNLRWGSERGADGFVIRRCGKRGGEDGEGKGIFFHGVSPLADTHPSVADFHLISGDFKDAFQIAFGGGLQLRIGAAVILIVFGTGNPLHISIFTIFGGDGRKRSGIFAGCHRSGRRCCCNRG
ncbi:DEAD/DEAH box helicase [Cardiobacterium hominis]